MSVAPRTLRVVEHPLIRLLPFVVVLGYLRLPGVSVLAPAVSDWVVSFLSASLLLFGRRFPGYVLLAQSTLLVAAAWWSSVASDLVHVLLVVSFAEMAFRRTGRLVALGAAGAAAAIAVKFLIVGVSGDVMTLVFRLGMNVGVPVLVGGYMRLLRQAAEDADRRASEVELRRESETRAARAAERTAIARELHDLVAHHVASIALRAATARHVAGDDPEVGRALEDIRATAKDTLSELRGLLAVLRDPQVVDADATVALMDADDLGAALDAVVERTRQAGLSVDARIDPKIHSLNLVRRGALFRVVQEALTNASRHAGPGARVHLDVALDGALDGEVARVDVANTLPAPAGPLDDPPQGHGLVGMRERMQLLGGTLTAGLDPVGWRVRATFPVAGEGTRRPW
ncbi:sensor histidine kinase [Streptoalloteichus tenebrarius]|uniref:sensor histidine kinase n=1 Tax=Streptoalloteichus tenebrarius (strain ATCC 17920 / DSM 40477 / JCM 4838 / CBS 697.72 / NBRC 16177 / NCIMB 11028 / NRRL B-12390 / A12253. 1 / ISP 5477) TaxID=1933 RepID=UPI0020A4BAC5|nr:histidine kinase [Streptoalloteichus tenebrarius]